jgi:hypothetical protein
MSPVPPANNFGNASILKPVAPAGIIKIDSAATSSGWGVKDNLVKNLNSITAAANNVSTPVSQPKTTGWGVTDSFIKNVNMVTKPTASAPAAVTSPLARTVSSTVIPKGAVSGPVKSIGVPVAVSRPAFGKSSM